MLELFIVKFSVTGENLLRRFSLLKIKKLLSIFYQQYFFIKKKNYLEQYTACLKVGGGDHKKKSFFEEWRLGVELLVTSFHC